MSAFLRAIFIGLTVGIFLAFALVGFRVWKAGGPRHALLAGHPALGPLRGSYFETGMMGDHWGEGIPIPFEFNLAAIEKGRAAYQVYCGSCHGETGAGDGVATRYGAEGVSGVADLRKAAVLKMADGELFGVVTRGRGKMIGYGETIPVLDRWEIVAWVRVLQGKEKVESRK